MVNVPLTFQLSANSPPTMAPSAMSVRRDSPRPMTVLPGGGELTAELGDLDQIV